jgi:hypothetical protein
VINRWKGVLLMLAVIGPLAGWLVAAMVAYLTPQVHESAAEIEMLPPWTAGLMGEPAEGAADRFRATQLERISGRELLGQVVREVDLSSRWRVDSHTARLKLKEAVEVSALPGTDLVRISVRHTHAEDAWRIADSVVGVYLRVRKEEVVKAQEALENAVRLQEERVERAREAVENFRENAAGDAATARELDRVHVAERAVAARMVEALAAARLEAALEPVRVHAAAQRPYPSAKVDASGRLFSGAVAGLLLPLLGMMLLPLLERLLPADARPAGPVPAAAAESWD